MKQDTNSDILDKIHRRIAMFKGNQFEKLVKAILQEAGYKDVKKQTAGYQGGFDIRGTYNDVEWRFEAKKTQGDALTEKELADKFDQIERNPGDAEYFIIVTNTNIANPLTDSINSHRAKWYIDLAYWSQCNGKFEKLLLSYPEAVIKELSLSAQEKDLFQKESKQYLINNKPFIEEEFGELLRASNRFYLLQNVANSISKTQEQRVIPEIAFSKLIERKAANADFERFKSNIDYPCMVLVAKEQMGKSSIMRLWAESVRKNDIVFFFKAEEILAADWIEKLQKKIYPEIERISGLQQYPNHLQTVFHRLKPRIEARDAHIYIFADALNAASYTAIEQFFTSDHFKRSLSDWQFNWVFSCREANWEEWEDSLQVPKGVLVCNLKEFNDYELELALKSHDIDLADLPHWIRPKLKWPGLLHLYKKMQSEKSDIFKHMPDMALAEMSMMFINDRFKEFARLHPGGKPISKKAVEEMLNDTMQLFKKNNYSSLPFRKIKELPDFDPHALSENAWNILFQQGFLTKNQDGYEVGNDWGAILLGKHLIDECSRKDIKENEACQLLNEIFDGIAPLADEKFETILWFALHYGKTCNISKNLFQMVLDKIFESPNLSRDYLSEFASRLFPNYAIQYLATLSKDDYSICLREGLQKVSSQEVVPAVIKLFPDASQEIKLQMAILLEHHNDGHFIEDIYTLIDYNRQAIQNNLHVENKLYNILGEYPDECCRIIEKRFEEKKIVNVDLAISLLGFNGTSEHAELLRKLMKQQSEISTSSLKAMGRLRLPETEAIAMRILEKRSNIKLELAAIEALGDLQSKDFLGWCKKQTEFSRSRYYNHSIWALQKFNSEEAIDFIISSELQEGIGVPFFNFHNHRQLNKRQFKQIVEGIVYLIEDSENVDTVWRGLQNLSALQRRKQAEWWHDYQGTRVPKVIADLARFCAQPRYFDSRGQTEGSSAMDKALEIVDWIGDKEVFTSLLLDLMERDIPTLFAWTLVSYIVKYPDKRYKKVLIEMAKYDFARDKRKGDIYEQVQKNAVLCLTHLKGGDVADVILEYRPDWWSDKDWQYIHSLTHFKSNRLIKKLVGVLTARDERLFWSTYCFLWELMLEEAIEPSIQWLKDPSCKDHIRQYLIKLLGKYDMPECITVLLEYLNDNKTRVHAMDALFYSADPRVEKWFKEKISAVAFMNDLDTQNCFLEWIEYKSYRECERYLNTWFEMNEIEWLRAEYSISLLYRIIGKFNLRNKIELVKNRYYKWQHNVSPCVTEATLKLIFNYEPDWSWTEFLKHWDETSGITHINAIKWVEFMLSEKSIEWLLNVYPDLGNFFSDEKAIRESIRKTINTFPNEIRLYGIERLKEKANSELTRDRIHAAQCTGLFGEEIYKQFCYLMNDKSVRVRELYRYADISE